MEVVVLTSQETAEELFVCTCNCAHVHLYVFMYNVFVSAFVSSGTLTCSVEARVLCQVSSLITFHFPFRMGPYRPKTHRFFLTVCLASP